MSLESIMRHFLATLYLLAIVALAADAAPAAGEGLGEAGAAVEEGCTTSAVLTSSGILCVLAQEVAAPSNGEPGKRGSAFLDGRNLVSIGDVVMVTLNYRLGALGVLAGIDGLKGNYGLVDHSVPGTASNT
jgi:hypothetical protein